MTRDTVRRTKEISGLYRIVKAAAVVWGKFSLRIAFFGIVFVAAGYILGTGIWAGILPIWGTALVLIGLSAFLITRYTYQ